MFEKFQVITVFRNSKSFLQTFTAVLSSRPYGSKNGAFISSARSSLRHGELLHIKIRIPQPTF